MKRDPAVAWRNADNSFGGVVVLFRNLKVKAFHSNTQGDTALTIRSSCIY